MDVPFFVCGISIFLMVLMFLPAVCVSLCETRLRRHRLRRRNSLMAERIARLHQIIAANSTSSADPDPLQQTALPSSVIDLPQAFAYGSAKGTEPRECSVCLSLVAGGARVRMLPNCTHVFHAECIDMWLSSHPTCPLCRAEAVPRWVRPEEKAVVEARVQPSAPPMGGVSQLLRSVSI